MPLLAGHTTVTLAQSNAAKPQLQRATECVQKQLNVLGYRTGTITGVIDGATIDAGKAYAASMRMQDPNWAMAPVSPQTAELWCEKVADAHHRAKEFWLAFQQAQGPGEAPAEPKTAATEEPVRSSWTVGTSPEGKCVVVGDPTLVSADLKGDHEPRLLMINTFGKDPNVFIAERAGAVEDSQTYVNIDGTMFPILPTSSGFQYVLLSRGTDDKGEIVWNTEPLMRLANKNLLARMKIGNWLAIQTVVRDGKDTGKTYTDLYSLSGFAEAKADADARCKDGPAKP